LILQTLFQSFKTIWKSSPNFQSGNLIEGVGIHSFALSHTCANVFESQYNFSFLRTQFFCHA
jgi:hypothetical protein